MHTTEKALLEACVSAVRALDPDILIGFDVQKVRSPSMQNKNRRFLQLSRMSPRP